MDDSSSSEPSDQSQLTVDVVRQSELWQVSDDVLVRAAQAAFRAAPLRGLPQAGVCIVLAEDVEVRELNRRFRGKDAATNVLSFPAGEGPAPVSYLGDIVLARGTILAEAAERGIPVEHHLSHLVVHGLLHLLGFAHDEEEEAEEMEALERDVLARLGIADPYAGEAADLRNGWQS